MKFARFVKYLLIAVCVIGVVIGIALISVDKKTYAAFAKNHIVSSLRTQGVLFDWVEAELSFSQLTARRITVTIPRNLLSFEFERCDLNYKLWQALFFALPADLFSLLGHCQAYGGSIEFDSQLSSTGQEHTGSIKLTNIELAKHPQLAAFGISSGTIELNAPNIQFNSSKITAGRFLLQIKNLDKPQATVLPPAVTRLPLPLTIPPINDLSINLPLTFSAQKIAVSESDLKSSLGDVSMQLEIARQGVPRLTGQFNGSLTVAGVRDIGPYLPLLSAGRLTPETRRFSGKIAGTAKMPLITASNSKG